MYIFGGQEMLYGTHFNQDISGWDVSGVTTMWVSAGTTGQIGLVLFVVHQWRMSWCTL